MNRYYIFFIAIAFAFTSCQKVETTIDEEQSDKTIVEQQFTDTLSVSFKLPSIVSSDRFQLMIEYDEQNRISKTREEIFNDDGKTVGYWVNQSIIYDEDKSKIIVKFQHTTSDTPDNSTTYYIKGNQITQDMSGSIFTRTIDVNSDGQPVRYSLYWPDNDKIMQNTTLFEYRNGNLITQTIKQYDNMSNSFINFTFTNTHDNNKTPFYHCATPKWLYGELQFSWLYRMCFNHNNELTQHYYENGNLITSEYTYDDAGFPMTQTKMITIVNKDIRNHIETFKFTYIKK